MSSIYEFSKHIGKLRSEKKFREAISFFKENKNSVSEIEIANNIYLVSDMLTCLRQQNHFDAGFKFLQIYSVKINGETNERILSAYGWLLWSIKKSEIKDENSISESNSDFHEDDDTSNAQINYDIKKSDSIFKIQELLPLLNKQRSEYSKTLISQLFNVVLKVEKQQAAINWKQINDFCNAIEVSRLSDECAVIQVEKRGKMSNMELASDQEKWFAQKTKALFKLGHWMECYELSKKALETFEKFHYGNESWFARRIALAKKNLGNPSEAITELKEILKRKQEWFIQKEISELLFEENDIENAFIYAIQAITNFGPLEFKVDLLLLLGKILTKKNENELAYKHYMLSKIIRQNEGWTIKHELIETLQSFDYAELKQEEISKIKNELKTYWSSFKKKSLTKTSSDKMEGIIIRILNNNERGKDGFLKHNNNEYYFSCGAAFHLTPKLEINTKVAFELLPGSTGKKPFSKIIKILV